MQQKWSLPTDQENRLTVESKLNFIMWTQGRAYAGFDAAFELRTILVGDGAEVRITCRTRKGKKLGTTEGAIFRNRFRGTIVIPEKVQIGDYVYLEAKLPNERYDGNVIKNSYNLRHAEKLFDGVLPGSTAKDSPIQWSNVLKKYPELKICLAHFGGYTLWKRIGDFSELAGNVRSREACAASGEYEASDHYRDWVQTTAELITEYDNVYTDISCFNNNIERSGGGSRHVAENLYFLITTYPDLIDRINMGSDWYMIEMSGYNGIGKYMLRMFNTLKMVTEMLVKGKENGTSVVEPFDVWHQFAVVNPLRYLGLIDDAKGSEGPFEVHVEKLEKLGERLKMIPNNMESSKNSSSNDKKTSIDETIQKVIANFKERPIISSKKLIIKNKFLILQK